jgi:hypothetical protein
MSFPLSSFESFIDDTILTRGRSYFRNDHVVPPRKTSKYWVAEVFGSDEYKVKIWIQGDEVMDTRCTCPYDWGPVCKHVVAVLYAIRDEETIDIIGASPDQKAAPVEKIIAQMTEEELRGALGDLVLEEQAVKSYLISHFSHYLKKESDGIGYYKEMLSALFESAQGRGDFIEYYEADTLGDSVAELIEEFDGNLEEKIRFCTLIINSMVDALAHADDSSGSMSYAIESAFEELFEILVIPQKNAGATEERIFRLAMSEMKKEKFSHWGHEDSWQQLALEACPGKKEAKKLIDQLETIKEQRKKEPFSEYTAQRIGLLQHDLLESWFGQEQSEAFLKNNLHFPDFREKAIKQAFFEENYTLAEELAKEGKRQANKQNHSGLVHQWTSWLMRIAEAKGDNDVFIQLKEEAFLKNGDMSVYKEIRNMLSEADFKEKVESWIALFRKPPKGYDTGERFQMLAKIFAAEKRYADLLGVLEENPVLHWLDYYYVFLKDEFPYEMASLYNGLIRDFMSRRANGRKDYQTCCAYLKKIASLGEREMAKNTAKMWLQEYPRRKAMKEELLKQKWLGL